MFVLQGRTQYGSSDTLQMRNDQVLQPLLTARGDLDDIETIRKLKDYYESCLDTDNINAPGNTPLLDLLQATGNKVVTVRFC